MAARAEDATAVLTAVSRADFAEGAVAPGLKVGNIVDKTAVVAAMRRALDGVVAGGRERSRDVTVVVPDAAARVLFVDFDELPSKTVEALPVVRFRLKKLLPFDADHAMVSYQVMSNEKGTIKLLAVAMPNDVLEEYESAVLAAGYLPGAVLPSTLAALAGLEDDTAAVLVVNASAGAVTTAIVRGSTLLLHRSVDMNVGGVAPVDEAPIAPETNRVNWLEEPGGLDRFDAEARMQSSVVETEIVREVGMRMMAHDVAQAVSVATAYFEDSLENSPDQLLVAGTLGAENVAAMMEESGVAELRVREMVDAGMIEAGAVTSRVPRGWLAGVRGALKN